MVSTRKRVVWAVMQKVDYGGLSEAMIEYGSWGE